MQKGEATRHAILERAADVATGEGLEGLSIGALARDLEMSKSGLFAHFQSKEGLQLQVVDYASDFFVDTVVRPALKAPRGETRLRALLDHWMTWIATGPFRRGCFFMAAAMEMDDRPGPVRDRVAAVQRDWMELLANVTRAGITEGHFRANVDPAQVAFELYGAMMAYQHASRLLSDERAPAQVRAAFEHILASAKA